MKIYNPLQHADYSVIDGDCACPICTDWRAKAFNINLALSSTHGHARNCYCDSCKKMRSARSAYLASLNRRDFYCELSWHASHSPSGQAIMAWANQQIVEHTDNWWYIQGCHLTLGYWLSQFGGLSSGAVSAFGFMASGMAIPA